MIKLLDTLNWLDISSAPKNEKMFLCREVNSNNVFEAMFFRDYESYEIPKEYDVLQNMYLDEPIDDISIYEWLPIEVQNEI